MEETCRLRLTISKRSQCLLIHIYVLLFVIGAVAIVLKEIDFQAFITLILNVNMIDSKNNQALGGIFSIHPRRKKISEMQCEGPISSFC